MGTQEIHHRATHTLQNDKPDIIIINAGSNNIKTDKPVTILEDIANIVITCKKYGVTEVFVSSLTPRLGCQSKIDELNKLLYEKQREFEYTFIKNDNIISSDHLWRDNIHLNNFIYALNKILLDDYLGN